MLRVITYNFLQSKAPLSMLLTCVYMTYLS